MLHILQVTFPFFALVAAGFVATRRHMLPLGAIAGLNAFVLYFALPCMLFRFGAGTPLAQLLDLQLALVYLLAALLIVGGSVALLRRGRVNWNDAAFSALVAAFPNSGFMGLPLIVTLLGTAAAPTVMMTIVLDLVLVSSLCIALSRLDGLGLAGARQAAGKALRGVASNPMPWSILLGAWASAAGWLLPAPIMQTVDLLADAASPVALFTIGAVLARSQLASPAPVPVGDYAPVVAIKLLVHPLLVGALGWTAQRLGLPVSDQALTVAVLVAALPSASNVSLLAERFGADNGRIARIILWTTIIAFFSFSAAVAWLT